jgi:hypothetical protein
MMGLLLPSGFWKRVRTSCGYVLCYVADNFCCSKVINGELGAYRSKLFVQQFRTTFKTLVADLQAKLPQAALKVKKDKGFFSPFAKKSKVEKDKDKEK